MEYIACEVMYAFRPIGLHTYIHTPRIQSDMRRASGRSVQPCTYRVCRQTSGCGSRNFNEAIAGREVHAGRAAPAIILHHTWAIMWDSCECRDFSGYVNVLHPRGMGCQDESNTSWLVVQVLFTMSTSGTAKKPLKHRVLWPCRRLLKHLVAEQGCRNADVETVHANFVYVPSVADPDLEVRQV